MLHEHTVGREYIKEIATTTEQFKSGNSETLQLIADNLSSYINLLHNHIQKEENILFPMAEKVLPTQKQNEIYEHFERIEEEVVGHANRSEGHRHLWVMPPPPIGKEERRQRDHQQQRHKRQNHNGIWLVAHGRRLVSARTGGQIEMPA